MDNEQPRSFFEMHDGEETWDMAAQEVLRRGGASLESRERDVFLFRGVRSMALHIECSILDLPHVVAEAPADGEVRFIAGDMFDHIPPADAVLLKVISHVFHTFFY